MKYCVLLFFFIFSLPAVGRDIDTEKLLLKSEKAFRSAGAMSAYFTINIRESGDGNTQSFDGTILIKGNKFRIDAPDYDIWFDGRTQWVYNESTNEVNISEPDAKDVQTMNPLMIYKIYRKGCDLKYAGEKIDHRMRKIIEITLIPKDVGGDIREVVLQINSEDFLPVYFRIHFRNNDFDNEIFVNRYDVNQDFSDLLFAFDISGHPDIEVIDLR
ncbi:MAG: outer-membrane lipoprotein carrier protein LolA [Dysgonamonadaceae bacterium]|jgi:outer membrane lipoprotein-sorting protein|nr:outer-membrane lipoprotein carrier protein LolA [Dysgonamonadaceae bacterium]